MDYARLLTRHDHPTHWEYPPGFDHNTATARFTEFVAALSALGAQLKSETGVYIQDASFHSQILIQFSSERHALIRFSNFGDMVTVSDDEPMPETTLQMVTELLAQHGYTYVPAAVLRTPYTGSNPGVTGISTWWVRYFDWV